MSAQSHLQSLRTRHDRLKAAIAEAHLHPSVTSEALATLKKERLAMKDAIARAASVRST